MVTVKLKGTFYYGNPKQRYGPGDAVEVPEGLATALGLTPIRTEEETHEPKARVSSKPRTKKAAS